MFIRRLRKAGCETGVAGQCGEVDGNDSVACTEALACVESRSGTHRELHCHLMTTSSEIVKPTHRMRAKKKKKETKTSEKSSLQGQVRIYVHWGSRVSPSIVLPGGMRL